MPFQTQEFEDLGETLIKSYPQRYFARTIEVHTELLLVIESQPYLAKKAGLKSFILLMPPPHVLGAEIESQHFQ